MKSVVLGKNEVAPGSFELEIKHLV